MPGPTAAVVYDRGAATPAEIGRAARRVGRLVAVLRATPDAAGTRALFEEFGQVVDLADGPDAVCRTLRAAGVDGVTTFSESALDDTAALAARLGLPFLLAPAEMPVLTDKGRQRAALAAAGVSPVRSAVVRDAGGGDTGNGDTGSWDAAVDAVGLPAVLKPARGQGSRDTVVVHDRETGRRRVAAAGEEMVLEELLVGRDTGPVGDYVSVEAAVQGGAVTPLVVTGKLPLLAPFRETGQFWPAALDDGERDALASLVVATGRALGLRTGLLHVEVKRTPDGPRVIEVNGRLGGNLEELAARVHGTSLVEIGLRLALGEPPRWPSGEPDGIRFQHYTPAPVHPCTLRAVRGTADVRRAPGVDSYRSLRRPGDRLPGGVATDTLDVLAGHAATVDDIAGIVAQATGPLRFVVEDADGNEHDLDVAALRGNDVPELL